MYTDASIHYWEIYEFRYRGTDPQMTEQMVKIRDSHSLDGPVISLDDLIVEQSGQEQWTWFQQTLQLTLVYPSYWTEKRHKSRSGGLMPPEVRVGDIGRMATDAPGPIGLVREVHLSEASRQLFQGINPDSGDLAERGLPSPSQEGGLAGSPKTPPFATIQDGGSPESSGDFGYGADKDSFNQHNSEAWLQTQKLHSEICSDIQTKEQMREFVSILQNFHRKIIQDNAPKGKSTEQGVASLPPAQRKRKEPRRQAPWS